MRLQQSLLGASEQNEAEAAYCLSQLEVFNWGPFCGYHRIEFNPDGCALIGQTGSGKTTLVDAMMTLICNYPRYNLASTGGHESDRDLMSYLRGVTGSGGEDESIHTARAGQTTTGISMILSMGDKTIRLTALLWLNSSSTSQSDMKRLWLFEQNNERDLSHHLSQLKELGVRSFKTQLSELTGVQVSENKKSYLAQCRRFFEIGENAFVLLNRAAGLKQLNSIDELFRELVLDDRAAFKRANEVANEFDELKGIHNELDIARVQQKSLLPIEKDYKKYQKIAGELSQFKANHQNLPSWYATYACDLWAQNGVKKQLKIDEIEQQLEQQKQILSQKQNAHDDYYQQYLSLGGSNIEQLKQQIEQAQQEQLSIKQHTQDYQRLCQMFEFDAKVSVTQFQQNQQLAQQKYSNIETQLKELDDSRDLMAKETLNAGDEKMSLAGNIKQVKASPDCNIPFKFLRFQQLLAGELKVSVEHIPFIGQCIEVADKEWQGAIERALGSHRLRLVIVPHAMKKALNWVNQRNNQLHVRLLNANDYQRKKEPFNDGYWHKLTFKSEHHQHVIENFVASLDRHCVDSAEAMQDRAFGLTQQGLMSGKQGLFEKQDQGNLFEGWMTGFDNSHQLKELAIKYQQSEQCHSDWRQKLDALKKHQETLSAHITLLKQLLELEYSALDMPRCVALLQQINQQLSDLQDPSSDSAQAEKQWQKAKKVLDEVQNSLNDLTVNLKVIEKDLADAQHKEKQAKLRIEYTLQVDMLSELSKHYEAPSNDTLHKIDELERQAMQQSQQKIDKHSQLINEKEVQLGKHMVNALKEDTGTLVEVGTELEDVNAYLERLEVLTKEDLPSKLERFKLYLNQSSDQGVTHLLSQIDNEVSIIEERIEDLNATLRGVDFQTGRYLQLIPQKVVHEHIQTLNKARKHLRSAELEDDQGEAHFHALMDIIKLLRDAVERKRTRPAQALLDPRYRLQFLVAIIDRETGTQRETLKGSKSGSGGEKELIASFILTASLSYALCPKNRSTPLFGTVILDEAFSKSSQAVAARIISALREFGLHPLFVTPNKEMRLLREHTSSVVLVHRRQQESRAVSLSWQDIEQHLSDKKSYS